MRFPAGSSERKWGWWGDLPTPLKAASGNNLAQIKKLHRGKYPLYFPRLDSVFSLLSEPSTLNCPRQRFSNHKSNQAFCCSNWQVHIQWKVTTVELCAEELYCLEGGVLGEYVLTNSFTALRERERKAGWSSLSHTLLRHECRDGLLDSFIQHHYSNYFLSIQIWINICILRNLNAAEPIFFT